MINLKRWRSENYRVKINGNSYEVKAKDSDEAVIKVANKVVIKDERLSPMTYKKLKEMGYGPNDWENWTQEKANQIVAKGNNNFKVKTKQKLKSETLVKTLSSKESKHPKLGNYTYTNYEYNGQKFSSIDRPEEGKIQITETHPYDNTEYNWAIGKYNSDGTISFNLISQGKRIGEPITVKKGKPMDKVFELIRQSNSSKKSEIDKS